jgi:NAD(P)H-dependent flavin oxidoreductase YrpB (nitropropane dioxygenase family)
MKALRTQLVGLLSVHLPIIQVPIGSASCPELAASVSNAGGLGMLALTWKSLDATRTLTSRPFGVNLVLEGNQARRVEICLDEKVPVISFSWGDPAVYLPTIRKSNAKVLHLVASAAEARRASDSGVDAIVVQGWEGGGHVLGQTATLPLLPAVVDAVSPLSVLEAGGIADGRGLAAALALGGAGVWVDTRFLASEEALTHSEYRTRVLQAQGSDTVYTRIFDGGWPNAPHRVLRNSTLTSWEDAGRPATGQRPGEGSVVAHFEGGEPVHLYDDTIPLKGMSGDVEKLALYAGQ